MVNKKPKTARAIAARVLNQFNPKRNYASQILDKLIHKTNEKQRATELVYGTIRNRFAIDTVIAKLADCPVERIPAKLLNIIRIAAFELFYSPETPEYSIVNEAVENTKTVGGQKQTSFVNAVLRQITRHIRNRQTQLSQATPEATLPQTPSVGCEFDTCFLPDPEASLADYLSIAFSLPKWLITDWLSEFGAESAQQICFASNRRPSIYIRPNTLKTTAQELGEKLRQAGIELEIVDAGCWMLDTRRESRIENQESRMLRLKSPRVVTELVGFAEGLFTVQDITASQAIKIMQPQPGWAILDLCAAPGTKTTQLAEATNDSATIIATDIDSQHLKLVKENIIRLGIKGVNIIAYEQIEHKATKRGLFNAILLDVPCSNTAVLAKRIEARYRLKPKVIRELTKTQTELLHKAATIIKHQGIICYSTCSIQKAENGRLVREFLQKNPNFELKSERLIMPSAQGFDHDGSYVAIIAKLKPGLERSEGTKD
ncbi:MAG: transcription antitermination factor NusB [Sedimentisphaerales bacterium]